LEDVALRQPVVCPNEGCGITISRKDLADHTKACPHSVAPCPLGEHGCAFSGNKAARDAHLTSGECRFEPLKEFFERYEERMRSVEDWRRTLQNEINEVKEENRAIKEENAALKKRQGRMRASLAMRSKLLGKIMQENKGLLKKGPPTRCPVSVRSKISLMRETNRFGHCLPDGYDFFPSGHRRSESGDAAIRYPGYTATTPFSELFADTLNRHQIPTAESSQYQLSLWAPLSEGGELVDCELTPAMLGMNLGGMNRGVEPTIFFQKKDHLRSPTIDPNTWSLNTF